MTTSIQCPGCKSRINITEALAGKKLRCQACGQIFLAPAIDVEADLPMAELVAPPRRAADEGIVSEALATRPVSNKQPLRQSRPAPTSSSSNLVLIVLLAVLGSGVLLGAIVFAAVLALWPAKNVALMQQPQPAPAPPLAPPRPPVEDKKEVFEKKEFEKKKGPEENPNPEPFAKNDPVEVKLKDGVLKIKTDYSGRRVSFENPNRKHESCKMFLVAMQKDHDYALRATSELFPPCLRVEDGANETLAEVKTYPGSPMPAQLLFTPPTTGTYCVVVASAQNSHMGNFQFSIHEKARPLPPGDAAVPLPDKTSVVYLSDAQEFDVRADAGSFGKQGMFTAEAKIPIVVRGKPCPRAVGMLHNEAGVVRACYLLDRRAAIFRVEIGVADTHPVNGSGAFFEVYGDARLLWKSNANHVVRDGTSCIIDVSQVNVLELRTYTLNRGNVSHAVWLDPRVFASSAAADADVFRPRPPSDTLRFFVDSKSRPGLTIASAFNRFAGYQEICWHSAGTHFYVLQAPDRSGATIYCVQALDFKEIAHLPLNMAASSLTMSAEGLLCRTPAGLLVLEPLSLKVTKVLERTAVADPMRLERGLMIGFAASLDGSLAVSHGPILKLYDLKSGRVVTPQLDRPARIYGSALNASGSHLYLLTDEDGLHYLRIFPIVDLELKPGREKKLARPQALEMSPDGQNFCLCSAPNLVNQAPITAFGPDLEQPLFTVPGGIPSSFCSGGQQFAVTRGGKVIEIYNMDGKLVDTLPIFNPRGIAEVRGQPRGNALLLRNTETIMVVQRTTAK